MFLQSPQFFNAEGSVAIPSYIDKTAFLSVLEEARSNGETAMGLCAPHGLGAATFVRMAAEFYGSASALEKFNSYKVSETPAFCEAGEHVVLFYDFKTLGEITPSDFIKRMAEETRAHLLKMVPGTKLDKDDVGQMIKQAAAVLKKTFVIVFSHFEEVRLCDSWQRYDVLTKVGKFFADLHNKTTKANALHFMLFSSACQDAFSELHVSLSDFYFYDISDPDGEYYDELEGWCGVTRGELKELMPENAEISAQDVYSWCGNYAHHSMRFSSVFRSIEEQDLIITCEELPGFDCLINFVNNGYCRYLPFGEIGFAALLNGEALPLMEYGLGDTHLDKLSTVPNERAKILAGFKKLNRYICNMLICDGLCVTQVNDFDYDCIELKLTNGEMGLAAYNVLSAEDEYFGALCSLSLERATVKEQLADNSWMKTFGNMTAKYLSAQRRFFNDVMLTIPHSMYDLLKGIDSTNYQLVAFENFLLLDPIDEPEDDKIVILAGVKCGLENIMTSASTMSTTELELVEYLNNAGYNDECTASIIAFCYDLNIPEDPKEEVTVECAQVRVSESNPDAEYYSFGDSLGDLEDEFSFGDDEDDGEILFDGDDEEYSEDDDEEYSEDDDEEYSEDDDEEYSEDDEEYSEEDDEEYFEEDDEEYSEEDDSGSDNKK